MGIWERLTGRQRLVRPGSPGPKPPQTIGKGFAVIDVETTGISSRYHRVVEIAVVQTDVGGRHVREWATRVNPQMRVEATHVHGITDADVQSAPVFHEILPELVQLLSGRAIVAHNAPFDLGFLNAEFFRSKWHFPEVPWMCTMREAAYFLPHLYHRRLGDCCHASGIQIDNAHSALGDARATATLLQSYLDPQFGAPPQDHHMQLPAQALSVQWPQTPARGPITVPSAARPLQASVVRKIQQQSSSLGEVKPLLEQVSTKEILETGCPPQAVGYIEVLLAALADGQVTETETQALHDVAADSGLSDDQRLEVNIALAEAMSSIAVADGVISKIERAELKQVLALIGFSESNSTQFFNDAKTRRFKSLSEGLPPLPTDWALGEPLRVGDNVVFTGCDDSWRERAEKAAHAAGVQVASGVSKKTKLLVSDGSFVGGKADKAAALGTRVVHPQHFDVLLKHIQPFQMPA